MVNDIRIGEEIRDSVFNGNSYAQLSLIRKSIWALAVLNNNIESSEEDKLQAQDILIQSKAIDEQIEEILKKHYPEEYE